MGKKIRMTFHANVPSPYGDYTLDEKLSIVDDVESIGSMTDVAEYMINHVEGFQSYTVEVFEEGEE